MATNLLEQRWLALDPRDLRDVLDARAGGPGQHRGKPDEFFIPLVAGAKLVLRFKDGGLTAIEPGVAYTEDFWRATASELDELLTGSNRRYCRQYSFSSYRVSASWTGELSQVAIHAPPPGTPAAPVQMADHPFVLEFPMAWSPTLRQNLMRRVRQHRSITAVLNIILAGYTSFLHPQGTHLWAISHDDMPTAVPKWVQPYFDGPLGDVYADSLTTCTSRIGELPAATYHSEMGHDGRPLSVPDDLDHCLLAYLSLGRQLREKFDRAAFWFDQAHRQWHNSASMSYAALVSSVESLLTLGKKHDLYCPTCKENRSHDVPGATEQFRAFFELHAPGESLRSRRSDMYRLRSKILHGSFLMHHDQFASFGWDPPAFEERALHEELWQLTRTALLHWLREGHPTGPSSRPTTA